MLLVLSRSLLYLVTYYVPLIIISILLQYWTKVFCSYVSDNNAKHYSRVESSTESLLTMVAKRQSIIRSRSRKIWNALQLQSF